MTRLPRAQRREQILAAATEAFARNGFAATSLDDIAARAGITRVILYRHFDSKADLYRAAIDPVCARLEAAATHQAGGFTGAGIEELIGVAAQSPAGFRLLFRHALREPEFKARVAKLREDLAESAYRQIAETTPEQALARWAARLAPAVAIEAIIAWLEAGQPQRERVAGRVRQAVLGVIAAVGSSDVDSTATS